MQIFEVALPINYFAQSNYGTLMSIELDKIIIFIQILANGSFVDKVLYHPDDIFHPTLILCVRSCLPSEKFNLDVIRCD
jgi:hypothetical protein